MEQPTHPRNTLAYRSALSAVIILSALIILALIALVAGAIVKLSGRMSDHVATASGTAFTLPSGARILSTETQPGRLIIHVRSSQGDEIDIIGTEDGRLIRQVRTAPEVPRDQP